VLLKLRDLTIRKELRKTAQAGAAVPDKTAVARSRLGRPLPAVNVATNPPSVGSGTGAEGRLTQSASRSSQEASRSFDRLDGQVRLVLQPLLFALGFDVRVLTQHLPAEPAQGSSRDERDRRQRQHQTTRRANQPRIRARFLGKPQL
jgi:hypothetical protein